MWIDCIDEPQKRLTVVPATVIGSFARNADQPRDVEALLALGQGAAQDHILDVAGVDLGALDQRRHHLRRDIVGPHLHERALLGEVEGRAGIARDHDGFFMASP